MFQTPHSHGSPVINPFTYHEGAIGSSPSDAAGRWWDGTRRGWEETYSSQVETRDEVGLQLDRGETQVSVSTAYHAGHMILSRVRLLYEVSFLRGLLGPGSVSG